MKKLTKSGFAKSKFAKLKGSIVRVWLKNQQSIDGIILPSEEEEFVLIKLESGYNIGIAKDNIVKIEKIGEKKLEKFPEAKLKSQAKKSIVVIIAGGTISSRVDYTTGAVSALMKPENLLFLVPELNNFAKIKVDFAFSVLSENITSEHWKILVKKVEKWLNDENVDGIIITHGTDTLHYTSSALSFMLKNINKPVVITYAQRSSDRPSTDAILNLIASAHVALSDIAEVVVVGHRSLDDKYCLVLRGTKVRKMHSTRRDTFRPINALPIAKVDGNGNIEWLSNYKKKPVQNQKQKPYAEAVFNEKVALVKFYPNADPEILNFYYKKGYKGIIIEATGMGHVNVDEKNKTKNWLNVINKLSKKMLICFTTQTIYGSLNQNVYSTARQLSSAGVVYLKDMLSETAYVKLGYTLAKTKNLEEAKTMMLTNLAGEFSARELPEFFLF